MEIYLDNADYSNEVHELHFLWKMDKDEKAVRKALVKAWTRLLEKYARPGVPIPPFDVVRKEMYDVGVKAAVDAYAHEHWWAFSFVVRREIEDKVRKGLNKIDLPCFVEDVKIAQNDPQMLEYLKREIKRYVMEG